MYRILFTVAALAAAPTMTAQERTDGTRIPFQFRVEVSMVFSYVSARDTNGRVVTDLEQDDFVVSENGVLQDITFFEREYLPLRIVFMMDISRSMDSRIIEVRDSVWAIIDAMREQDEANVVIFDRHGVSVSDGFTSDKRRLKIAADSFGDGQDTRLYTALYTEIRQFKELDILERSAEKMYRNIIILFTDGEDTGSTLHSDDDVLYLAQNSDIIIYTFYMPALPAEYSREKPPPKTVEQLTAERFLLRIAEDTGGRRYEPKTPAEVKEAHLKIAEEIAMQYKIGYSSNMPPGSEPEWRRISITLAERENIYLRHRKGYTSEPDE